MMELRRGMTLVELLIVVAIIAVIAGLSMSVLMRVRQRAYLATCISNLRQLVQAVHMYENDWGGVPVEHYVETEEGWCGWVQQMLYPYVRNDDIFLCPADFSKGRVDFSEGYPGGGPKKFVPVWKSKEWVTSYYYYVNIVTVREYGRGIPRVKPHSILFECLWHVPHFRAHILARYDGVVEVEPVGRYKILRAEFEAEPSNLP